MIRQLPPIAVDAIRLSIWLVILMIIFLPLEKRFALHPRKAFRKSFTTDLLYYFLSNLLPKLLLTLPISLLAWTTHRLMPGGPYEWIAQLPVWVRLTLALVVADIGSYWGHRWSHEFPFLWRFHALHHSAEEIDWLVNTRAHPVDMVFTRLCGLVPTYLLGLAQPLGDSLDLVPLLVTLVGTLWGFFIHANLKWRFGWLEQLVSSPAFHHWHHTNDSPAQINKNYASMLPFIDRLFGSLYLPEQQWPEKYGTDQPIASDVAGQLLQPILSRNP